MGGIHRQRKRSPPETDCGNLSFSRNLLYRTDGPLSYTDQFPFAACKVPGIWLFRRNCLGGIFYHHRADNTPDKLGFEAAAKLVEASADLMEKLADREDISDFRGIPADLQKKIDVLYSTVYNF